MKTFTLQEIAEWAKNQPSNQMVFMNAYCKRQDGQWANTFGDYGRDCGCLMVQFGKDMELDFDECTNQKWIKDEEAIAMIETGSIWTLFYDLAKGEIADIQLVRFEGTLGELVKKFKPQYQ